MSVICQVVSNECRYSISNESFSPPKGGAPFPRRARIGGFDERTSVSDVLSQKTQGMMSPGREAWRRRPWYNYNIVNYYNIVNIVSRKTWTLFPTIFPLLNDLEYGFSHYWPLLATFIRAFAMGNVFIPHSEMLSRVGKNRVKPEF